MQIDNGWISTKLAIPTISESGFSEIILIINQIMELKI